MRAYLTDIIQACHESVDIDDEDPCSGYAYMRGRGITDEQIQSFRLGVGISKLPRLSDTSEDAERFKRQFRDTLSGQIIIPLYAPDGTLMGLETRLYDDSSTRRYTQYYLSEWVQDPVFLGTPQALPSIWESKTAILTEGVFDLFVVQRVAPNVICPLTARVSPIQNRFLTRWCDKVVFMFDSDMKGRSYTQSMMDKNIQGADGYDVYTLKYPAKDPSALYQKVGYHKFSQMIQSKLSEIV
jgi:DNA primase